MPKAIDLTGRTFGYLTVVEKVGKNRAGGWDWSARCVCGGLVKLSSSALSRQQSCGCMSQALRLKKRGQEAHGSSEDPLYGVWVGMRSRCGHLPTTAGQRWYVSKGITVCERWRNSFAAFAADMGPRPSPQHTIDRIDNDAGYSPANCRWATKQEQAENRGTNLNIEHNGTTRTLSDWARHFGVSKATAHERYRRGLPFDEIFAARPPVASVEIAGRVIPVAECAKLIGVTRTSAYRLHREGALADRVATSLSGSRPTP